MDVIFVVLCCYVFCCCCCLSCCFCFLWLGGEVGCCFVLFCVFLPFLIFVWWNSYNSTKKSQMILCLLRPLQMFWWWLSGLVAAVATVLAHKHLKFLLNTVHACTKNTTNCLTEQLLGALPTLHVKDKGQSRQWDGKLVVCLFFSKKNKQHNLVNHHCFVLNPLRIDCLL